MMAGLEDKEILENYNFKELESSVLEYYPDADIAFIRKAFLFAQKKHRHQKRSSGEEYIYHPLAVAKILADMHMDLASIATGLLHDTLEDTECSASELENEFGKEVSFLVDGVTKLGKISVKSSHERQAENYRKMILAMGKDLRVILVKLADRTHNMRTLKHLKAQKQQRIAQETLDIYAPLANRMGISWMKTELEDWGLKYTKPEIYTRLRNNVAQRKDERREYIEKLTQIIEEKIARYGLNVEVYGRAKHFYSIFKKMEAQGIEFDEIHDLVAFRIITQKLSECYEVLGIVHSFFKPVPGRFKDYIAMPKNNLYQSLHTTIIGPFGERLEIQIRTAEMHNVAESGIAAHWQYKSGKMDPTDSEKFKWLRKLIEEQENTESPSEYLESVKLDLFMGDIYVFSPKGELLEFPVGSTPLDFAFTIHTDVGIHCSGAKVNGRLVPLRHKLRSGDTVEIITSPTQKPSKDWLKIVQTSRAKNKIRTYIRSEERLRARKIGYDLLDRAFRNFGASLTKFEKKKDLEQIISSHSYASFEEMLIAIGYGKVEASVAAKKLVPTKEEPIKEEARPVTGGFLEKVVASARKKQRGGKFRPLVRIQGMDDDILLRFGKCCNPLPGDEIIGYISRGRGISVHKLDCKKILDLDPNRSVEVSWDQDVEFRTHEVKLRVICHDEPGLLNLISQTLSECGINIMSLNIRVNKNRHATGLIDVEVRDKDQLHNCIQRLESIKGIISVDRI